jgi:hypothetical protein
LTISLASLILEIAQMTREGKASEHSPFGEVMDSALETIGIFWVPDKGNFVALSFQKIDKNAAAAAFTSPTATGSVDADLLNAFREMGVGDALSLPKGQVSSDRSFKVRVNKAAKAALRKLEWGEVEGNYVVRIVEIEKALEPATNGTNGTAATPAATPAPTPPTPETVKTK